MGMVLVPLFWIILYSLFGHYRNIYRRSRLDEFVQTLVQTLAGVLVIFFLAILDDVISSYVTYYTSASVLFVLHFVFTYAFRFIVTSRTVYQIHNRQIGFKTLIIGGSSSALEMYQNLVNQSKSGGNLIVGFVNGMDDQGTILKKYIPYLGSYKDLKKVILSKNIEEVLIAIEQSEQNLILEEIINDLE
jgi:FlaA1/EpsC-like NDP-sugar epimerase